MKSRKEEYYRLTEELQELPEQLDGCVQRAFSRLSRDKANDEAEAKVFIGDNNTGKRSGKNKSVPFGRRWAVKVAAVAAALLIVTVPFCNASFRAYAQELFDRIAGNFGGDFYEPIENCSVTADGITLEVSEVWFEQDEARITYSLSFPEGCSELAESAYFFEDRTGGVFYRSELFSGSTITAKTYGTQLWYYEVADCSLTGNKLTQQLILFFDGNYTGDVDLHFELADLKLGDRSYRGPWSLDCSFDCGKYGGTAKITPISLKMINSEELSDSIELVGYSYNATGLKLYANDRAQKQEGDSSASNAVLRCTDDLGNVYYYYYGSTDAGEYADMCYTIYRKDNYSGLDYVTYHDFDAASMTVEIGEFVDSSDRTVDVDGMLMPGQDFVPLSVPLTIELKLAGISQNGVYDAELPSDAREYVCEIRGGISMLNMFD